MNIVLLGMPGAGKGTQGKFIKDHYSIPHISTGDMFREAIAAKTPMGVEASSYMDRGELVPDSVVLGMVKERIAKPDCSNGFILDGFPRNESQAQSLDEILSGLGKKLGFVLDFVIPQEEAVRRLSSRRTCSGCGKIYNLLSDSFKSEGHCNDCGAELLHRNDDQEEVILNRLKVYEAQTAVLKSYYGSKGNLVTVEATRPVNEVFEELKNLLI